MRDVNTFYVDSFYENQTEDHTSYDDLTAAFFDYHRKFNDRQVLRVAISKGDYLIEEAF